MKTNHLATPSSNFSTQTVFGSFKRKFSVVIAVFLLANVTFIDLAVAASAIAVQKSEPSQFEPIDELTTKKSIPSLPDYQVCLSMASAILDGTADFGNSDCNEDPDVRFCIKRQFVMDNNDCALYL